MVIGERIPIHEADRPLLRRVGELGMDGCSGRSSDGQQELSAGRSLTIADEQSEGDGQRAEVENNSLPMGWEHGLRGA